MSKEVALSNKIQPVCLPRPNKLNYPANINVYAIGWGVLNELENKVSDVLYNVKLKLFHRSACKLVAHGTKKNWTNQICSGKNELFKSNLSNIVPIFPTIDKKFYKFF